MNTYYKPFIVLAILAFHLISFRLSHPVTRLFGSVVVFYNTTSSRLPY